MVNAQLLVLKLQTVILMTVILVPALDALLAFSYLQGNVFLALLLNAQVILQDVHAINVQQVILYWLLKINVV